MLLGRQHTLLELKEREPDVSALNPDGSVNGAAGSVNGAAGSIGSAAGLIDSAAKSSADNRHILSLAVTVLSCTAWLFGLGQLGVAEEGLPWYLTISAVGLLSVRFIRRKKIAGKFFDEPVRFSESFALTYLFSGLAILAVSGWTAKIPPVKHLVQLVDIQLVSETDAANRHNILPGTVEQDNLRKRRSDKISTQGDPLSESLPIKAPVKNQRDEQNQQQGKEKERAEIPSQNEPKRSEPVSTIASPVKLPPSWSTRMFGAASTASGVQNPNKNNAQDQPFLSEMPPPELVELMENDGDISAMHIFQQGGSSSGGKGADNDLSVYLKALHKTIKNSWSPPQGITRRIEVLFRLKRDGHLASLKITESSGEQVADTSALKAIMAAAGKPLPKSYKPVWLDIAYTFKYNVNELTEVKD